MSWSFSLSGHSADPQSEAKVIDALKAAARESGAERGHVSTSYHGGHNLLDTDTLTKWAGKSEPSESKAEPAEAKTEAPKGKSASKN